MRAALIGSVFFHMFILMGFLWSTQLSLLFLQTQIKSRKDLFEKGTIQVALTYKPTFTPMKEGQEKKDLPPPAVVEKSLSPETPTLTKIKKIKKHNLSSLFNKMREESVHEKRPFPTEDNFPMHALGQKNSLGTGGRSFRPLSPAEQALTTAMKKYFSYPGAETMRKKFPNVQGLIQVKLAGLGNQFQIVAMETTLSSGFSLLDQSCEFAVRRALAAETFASDIIQELNGKETSISCQP